jgi:type 1 glutamine amidotransferase
MIINQSTVQEKSMLNRFKSVAILAALISLSVQGTATFAAHPNGVVWEGDKGPGQGKHIVFIAGDHEYRGEETLPALARIMAKHYGFKCSFFVTTDPKDGTFKPGSNHITGLEALKTADLMVLFTRFQAFKDDQMQHIEDYLATGKPVIGLRTTTHGFKGLKGKFAKYNDGYNGDEKEWKAGFGEAILGEHWVGHYGRNHQQSSRILLEKDQRQHPILRGVKDVHTQCGGYNAHPRKGSIVLAKGQILNGMKFADPPDPKKEVLPVVWVRHYKADNPKSRVFATTHGASEDIVNEGFRRILVNAHLWCLGMDDSIKVDNNVSFVGPYNPVTFKFNGYRKGVKPADIEGWDTPILGKK